MANLALQIEHELQQAFPVKDEGALKRAAALICEHTVDRATYAHDRSEIHGDIRVLAETMKLGFEQMEKRIDQMNRRFDDVQRNFERHMTTIQWGGSLLFGLLAALMSLYKFMN